MRRGTEDLPVSQKETRESPRSKSKTDKKEKRESAAVN